MSTIQQADAKGVVPTKVSPVKLAHVVLRTIDKFDEMVAWYETVLNARKIWHNPGASFLSYDDEHHRIAIVESPGIKERDGRYVGLDHIAFTYADGEDLLNTFARLKSEGIEPFGCVNHGPTTSLYYNDPDGNRVELQIDNFEDMNDATQLMTDRYETNALGTEFDPQEAYDRMLAGEDVREITRVPDVIGPPDMALVGKLLSS
ncbi:VOC family protein [Rhizorhabdus sp.]|uniref:VOC family protein n=1 Tax=Rhizorhabdus sp. TaxID=1968843 RepID=UPI0019B733D9|nr:VOC family protein [Rhizorhabdus sp.]MBD3759635.1 VOC family protein [Rhizorhabdus sp.]